MLAITILGLSVVIASGIGIAAYRISNRFLRRLWARAFISVLSGAMVFLSAGVAFFYYAGTTPANDAQLFQDHEHLRVSLWGKPAGFSSELADGFQIEVVVPRSVRVNQDFSFRLSISTQASEITLPKARAALASPNSARSRTLDSCKNQPVPNLPDGAVAACSNRGSGAMLRSLTWDVTPSQAGSIRLAVILLDFPPVAGQVDASQPWHATIEVNGTKIMRTEDGSYIGPPHQPYVGSSGRGQLLKYAPFYLTPENPVAEISGFRVDLSSMQLRIPIDVKATLGVNERAYGYMAIIGTVLAGILGTGWIWQLIGFVRSRKEKRSNQLERPGYDSQQNHRKKKDKNDIFISYDSEDRDRVIPIVKTLRDQGRSLFWDWTSIPVGKTWRELINKELESARCVLVIWSKKSVDSEWVFEEAEFGKKRKILIPVLIDEVDVPIGFGQIQTARLIGWNGEPNHEGFQQVIGALTELLGSPNIYEEDKLVLEKHIDTSKLKKIMGIIYQEYNLSQTMLMEPDIDDIQTQIHSHTQNGYFNFLIKNSEKKYTFKYWDNADKNRFLIIYVDNNKPELRLELNLSFYDNREIKSRLEKFF